MNGYYYATKAAASNIESNMMILIFLGIVFGVVALWAMCSVISMSRSLKDIKSLLQVHFTINDPPKPTIIYKESEKEEETESETIAEVKTEE